MDGTGGVMETMSADDDEMGPVAFGWLTIEYAIPFRVSPCSTRCVFNATKRGGSLRSVESNSLSGVVDADLRARRVGGYETARPDVQAHVPVSAKAILELGCSTGALGAALKQRQDTRVVGVEMTPEYAVEAETRLDRVIVSDVEAFLDGPVPEEAPFDCLIAADVLEHLVDPWSVLRRAADLMAPGATAVLSLPNVTYGPALWKVLRTGHWPREDAGTFDRTHLRWFTLRDALDLLTQAGLEPSAVEPRYWKEGWRLVWRRVLSRTSLQRFLAAQYVLSATKSY